MRWFQNAGNWFRQLMAGRYGVDALGRALSIGGLAALVLSMVMRIVGVDWLASVLIILALASIIWSYFRIFSRNFQKRSQENEKFLRWWDGVCCAFRLRKECFSQRKDYAFFRCPSCRQMVRVPRGKGRIRITCRKCGFAFEKKT